MKLDKTFITINHLEDYNALYSYKPGDVIILKKDRNNPYDDEAIAAYGKHGNRCGYVANSVGSTARGTYSAGRIYDRIKDESECRVWFVTDGVLICEIRENAADC